MKLKTLLLIPSLFLETETYGKRQINSRDKRCPLNAVDVHWSRKYFWRKW